MKIPYNKTIGILIYLFYTIIGVLSIAIFRNMMEVSIFIGIYVLIHLMMAVLFVGKNSGKLLSMSSIFVAFLYLFHCGQVMLYSFVPGYRFTKLDLMETVGNEKFWKSTAVSVVIITFIVIGIIFYEGGEKRKIVQTGFLEWFYKKGEDYDRYRTNFKLAGWFIVLTTFPIHLTISYKQFMAATLEDYWAVFDVQISGVAYTYSQFFLIGITLLMIAYKNSKVKLVMVYTITVIYFIWSMLSGSRGKAIIAIVYFTFLLFKMVRVSIGKLIILCIVAYCGLIMLNVIAENRNNSVITMDMIIEGIREADSPILETLEEFGGTQWTVSYTLDAVPSKTDFRRGSSYILSLASLLPDVGNVLAEVNKKASFFYDYRLAYTGGSIIAELYANFGYFSILFAMVIGMMIGRLSHLIERAFAHCSYYVIPFLTLFFVAGMWWIRDSFTAMVRTPIWGVFYLMIILGVVNRLKSTRKA